MLEIFKLIIKENPIYFRYDQLELEGFIKIYDGKGKDEDILYNIVNGNIRPSKKLIVLYNLTAREQRPQRIP